MGQMRFRRTGPWVKISCPFSWVQFRKKRAGLDGNNGKLTERMAVKSTNRSRNDSDLCLRLPHNPEVAGSSPVSATKSVTVVDTISTTVTFYFSPPEKGFPRKTGVLPNIPGNKRSVCPDLLRPWWENPGLSKTAIVIRVETINDYFPYINPLKAEMLRWALDGFSFITVWQKGLKGQNRASIILTNLVLFLI